MKNRMKRRSSKSRIWIAMMLTAVVTVSVWMAETGIVKAATVNDAFIVGGEIVYASLSGDANSVTGMTSYTKGPGVVEVMVSGDAIAPGSSQVTALVAIPPAVNTPGGASGKITPPAGKVIVSARSHHYAAINGASDYRDLTLF